MKILKTHHLSKCHNHGYFCLNVRVENLPSIHCVTGVMVSINNFLIIYVDVHIPEPFVIPQKKDCLVMESYTAYYPDIQLALNSIPLIMLYYATFLFTILSKKKQNNRPELFFHVFVCLFYMLSKNHTQVVVYTVSPL